MYLHKGEKAVIVNNGHMIDAAKPYIGEIVIVSEQLYLGYNVTLPANCRLTDEQKQQIQNFIWAPGHLKKYCEVNCF